MNAINILEQQHADEVLRLEIAYSNLYKAYVLGDRNEIINHYIATGYIGIPNFAKLVQSKTKQEMLSNRILPDILPTSIDNIKDDTLLRMNIVGCLKALQNEINIRNIYRNHYTYAQKILYQPNHIFRQEEILYKDSQGQQLTVSDILAVSKYAVSLAEAITPDNENFAKANAAITALQGIDAILNNKPEDKPINKMLHLVTSFISSVVKSSIKNDEAKRGVKITALMDKPMNRIKKVLEERGIKQTWLAEKLGKSFCVVNAYVCNRRQPSLEVLFEIAKILNIDPKDLIDSRTK